MEGVSNLQRESKSWRFRFQLVGSFTSHVTIYYCLIILIPAVNVKLRMFSGMTELATLARFSRTVM